MTHPGITTFLSDFPDWSRYTPPADPFEWAEGNVMVPMEGGSTVPFRFDYAPYWREPYEELFNPDNREVVFQWFSRGGKTLLARTACGYHIAEFPRNIGIMLPTSGQMAVFSKQEIQSKMVEMIPPVLKILGDGSSTRDKRNTIEQKKYPGGQLRLCGANSFGGIRTIIASWLWSEEIDAIQQQGQEVPGEEGDRLKAFEKRGDEFSDTVRIYTSYPSMMGRSRIYAKLRGTDYRQWNVACPKCGFDKWIMDRERDLRYDIQEPDAETRIAVNAVLECPECHTPHDDKTRVGMARRGQWIASRSFHGRAGFHANSMLWPHNYPGGYLLKLAQDMVDAEQNPNPERARQVIVNSEDAMPYRMPSEEKIAPNVLMSQREDYDGRIMLPEQVMVVVAAIDFAGGTSKKTQMEIKGLAPNMETYGIEYLSLEGEAMGPEVQKQIEAVLERKYTHPKLGEMGISATAFDAGKWGQWVGAMTYGYKSRFAIKGFDRISNEGRQSQIKLTQLSGNPKEKCWHIGTNEIKDQIYQQLRRQPGDGFPRGYRHHPKTGDYNERYFNMLTAEDFRYRSDGEAVFTCPDNAANEALDINVYIEWIKSIAAVRRLFIKRQKEVEAKSDAKSDAKTEGKPKPKRKVKRRNFVTDY